MARNTISKSILFHVSAKSTEEKSMLIFPFYYYRSGYEMCPNVLAGFVV